MTPTVATSEIPPPFDSTNVVELVSVDTSKIINVSLYSGRAEITRLYKFPVRVGQNQVIISGLPNALDHESIRVEGRGAATIHEVALSNTPVPKIATTSPGLEDLLSKKEHTQKALARCQKAIASLETYLSTLDVQHLDVTKLGKVMDNYDMTGEKLDEKAMELERRLENVEDEIRAEREKLLGPSRNNKLGQRATIGIFAEFKGEIEIILIYAVQKATWSAGYDIRVDMKTKEQPVTLIYKAEITQSTGEAWDDVPLSLETASPTFGVDIPKLLPWILFYKPLVIGTGFRRMAVDDRGSEYSSHRRSREYSPPRRRKGSTEEDSILMSPNRMRHRGLSVSPGGTISATFRVPGVISIPSDGASHNVTIVQLKLDASMSWISVPKIDAKTYLKAKIQNTSTYTLLRGAASVYVDGSFISRSDVPPVSPQESFDCPLGLDPSIRVTYHPRVKKVSRTGFYTKAFNHVFSQRITIFNTKSTAIENLKIIDQLPVSENSQIAVKLVSPNLISPETPSIKKVGGGRVRAPSSVKISDGVVAQWIGADEQDYDMEVLGKDGNLYWLCSVPSQGKINLLLSWEVTAPLRTEIFGL